MTSFFSDLLTEITERGRRLIGNGQDARGGDLGDLCNTLLSGSGEASGAAVAKHILELYGRITPEERVTFFHLLAEAFGPDREATRRAAEAYLAGASDEAITALEAAAEPRRRELIRRLNMAPGGTAALVAMRADLLAALPDNAALKPVDRDFQRLFASWFNRGFLVLRRIDWNTPAAILEKIIHYEAVHAISDWTDLRHRIDLPDRRLYAFFHPMLADDPLIFVEVALTRDMPDAIGPVLDIDHSPIDPADASVATFYSISNCQVGLRGISFGSFLIKQVVDELVRELPRIRTFVTLSPIPDLARWLEREMETGRVAISAKERKALALLRRANWQAHEKAIAAIRPVLTALAAHYFLKARDGKGRTPDPVARFHLGNGARLERINWLADTSDNGMAQSYGLMVNYLYDLRDIEKNHEAFANEGTVAAAKGVRALTNNGIVKVTEQAAA